MTEQKKRGRWKAGESGNPNGRPPGIGEVTRLRQGIAAHLPEIIGQLVEKAKEGDTQAARLLLERVLPTMKAIEQPVTLALPDGDMTAQGVAIVQAVADGTLAPGQGAALLGGLGALARIKELDELERRIAELERMKDGND
ncbi:DUF5681 domain-containing protein [Methylobacillus sp.]|uniref:DUF5681 domain-containing protein n=1 Tax=Methylobacillus sp. TaxID=56818 RepID=UPI002FDFCAF5